MPNSQRDAEIGRYVQCYNDPKYGMGKGRKHAAEYWLDTLPRGSLLDVGAGRGELGEIADRLGFEYVGVEPVPYLASTRILTGVATDLPFEDGSFDTVVCLDVLEHLIPDDVLPALEEMLRVALSRVFLTASEKPSLYGSPDGKDLHISKRPIAKWELLLRDVFETALISRLGQVGVSPGWMIELQ